ncbi:MAG: hypothetical protein ACKOTB_09375, partial [Planctomycetia bacterium]
MIVLPRFSRDVGALVLSVALALVVAPRAAEADWAVVGVEIVPHRFSTELRWRRPPDPRPGMLVRLFVEAEERPAAVTIDGRTPAAFVAAGEWTWHDLPGEGEERVDAARDGGRRLHVWTFIAVGEAWTPVRRIEIVTPADAPGGSS